MDDKQSGSGDTLNTDDMDIPGYLTYVVLVYRLASTVFVIGMGGLIISTILKTRSLHNVHNVLIVNIMVCNIVTVVAYTFQTTGMMFSYIIGIQDPFRCDVMYFSLFPVIVIMYTFVMLSVDKFIAIKFALRYKAIVTYRRVCQVITAGWIIALLIRLTRLIYEIASGTEYDKSSQFGSCSIKQSFILVNVFTTIIPILLAFSLTITLDIYLSIKAYQIYKNIQGQNGEGLQTSETKLNKTLQQLKPMITLLVTILGSLAISVISSIVKSSIIALIGDDESYQMFAKPTLIILSNSGYLTAIMHTLVYGLYFKQIRQPLCRKFKRMTQYCTLKRKMNSIVPSNNRSIRRA